MSYGKLRSHIGLIPWVMTGSLYEIRKAQLEFSNFGAIEKSIKNINNMVNLVLQLLLLNDFEKKDDVIKLEGIIENIFLDLVQIGTMQDDLNFDITVTEKSNLITTAVSFYKLVPLVNRFLTDIERNKNWKNGQNDLNHFYVIISEEIFPSMIKTIQEGRRGIEATHRTISEKFSKAFLKGTTIIASLFLGIVFSSIRLFKGITVPLQKLSSGADIIGSGKLDYRINLQTTDELGFLAKRFDKMAEDLSLSNRNFIESKEYTDNILRSVNDIIFVVSPQNTIVKVNQTLCSLLGYSENKLLGHSLEILFYEEKITFSDLLKSIRLGRSSAIEKCFVTSKGGKVEVLFSISVLYDRSGIDQGIVCAAQDITTRKKAERALKDSEERYALAIRGANDGLWDWNIKTDNVFYSLRWKYILGYTDDEIADSTEEMFSRIHKKYLKTVHEIIENHLSQKTTHFEFECQMKNKEGKYLWVLIRGAALWEKDGTPYRMSGSMSDINNKKMTEIQLEYDLLHDALTGLPNRTLLLDRLNTLLKHTKRDQSYLFAVMVLDLDRFKVINDSLGHFIGDKLLIQLAGRFKNIIRAKDTVARLGGDEFAIIMDDIKNIREVKIIAERLIESLNTSIDLEDREIFTSVSIGIALNKGYYEKPDEILRDADAAMYDAKSMGKARFKIFDKKMHLRAMKIMEVERDLRSAIKNKNEFRVLYQPIFSLKDQKIIGAEALLRWEHHKKGLIMPDDFIPLAEETGLIVPIGDWVITSVSNHIKMLNNKGFNDFKMSINCSARQLHQQDFTTKLMKAIGETKIHPHSVCLEITETTAMKDLSFTITLLNDLYQKGFSISLDDFGTGYSSMEYLKRFKVNTIKIDYSFVKNIPEDQGDSEIVRAIIAMSHSLRLQVIAEGVEKKTQLDFLRSLNCDYAQGYFLGRPKPVDVFLSLLQEEKETGCYSSSPDAASAISSCIKP